MIVYLKTYHVFLYSIPKSKKTWSVSQMLLAKVDEVIKASPAIQIQGRITPSPTSCLERVARERLQPAPG